jgi:hypothetical protein
MLEKVETETRYPCRIVRQLCVSQIAVKGKLLCLHERATGSDDSCYGAKPRARRKWVRMTRWGPHNRVFPGHEQPSRGPRLPPEGGDTETDATANWKPPTFRSRSRIGHSAVQILSDLALWSTCVSNWKLRAKSIVGFSVCGVAREKGGLRREGRGKGFCGYLPLARCFWEPSTVHGLRWEWGRRVGDLTAAYIPSLAVDRRRLVAIAQESPARRRSRDALAR